VGKGVFATRTLARHAVVGVYVGERLSQAAERRRHGAYLPERMQDADARRVYMEEQAERAARLGALVDGAPMGGAKVRRPPRVNLRAHQPYARRQSSWRARPLGPDPIS
jgi:hypothetical protein